jgi:predicted DCC family thiol-disulfide oxidoreductase YuxK
MKLLLFDGVCNLCNSTVQWIIRHDPEGKIQFAALQSDAAQVYLERFNFDTKNFNSLLFIDDNGVHTESSGALHIAKTLDGLYGFLATLGFFIPTFIRDSLYRFIAKNRYRFWGQRKECMLPTPELRKRFLN